MQRYIIILSIALSFLSSAVFGGACPNWNTEHFFKNATLQDVQTCIKNGADANARGGSLDSTHLNQAVKDSENADVIKILLNAGADVNEPDSIGWTPLHWAKSADVITTLLNAGADVNAHDLIGWTPLYHATLLQKNVDVILALLNAGADVNEPDEDGTTPLHRAAWHNNADVIKALIESGAKVNARNKNNRTPLHEAAKYSENADVIMLLLKAGADAKARDFINDTPFDLVKANDALKGTAVYRKLHNLQYE